MIDDNLEEDYLEVKTIRRYDPELFDAYCKYCYTTHPRWVFMGEFWECQVCEHGTADEYMQIEGVEMSPEQLAFYRRQGVNSHAPWEKICTVCGPRGLLWMLVNRSRRALEIRIPLGSPM